MDEPVCGSVPKGVHRGMHRPVFDITFYVKGGVYDIFRQCGDGRFQA